MRHAAVTSSTPNGDVKKSGSPTPSSSGTLGEGGGEGGRHGEGMKKEEGSDDHTNVPPHPTLPTLLSYHTSPYLSPQVACSMVAMTTVILVSVTDCRTMVKTLVCGMKTITWGAGSCKVPGSSIDYGESLSRAYVLSVCECVSV